MLKNDFIISLSPDIFHLCFEIISKLQGLPPDYRDYLGLPPDFRDSIDS